ncbi:hypothetical protein HMSSN139_56620 [Paenibacillus sp. HMSSN-139]|nr:hypothetical protein HMSSN139_56620 [Paenibacillus sp. HMSSN-139]
MEEQEWIGGKHSLLEALHAGRTINKIWVAEGAQKHLTQPIVAEAKNTASSCSSWTSASWTKWRPVCSTRAWSPR